MQPLQDLELITTVDLAYKGTGDKPVYHFVYASQLYGTLFAVYAKFDGQEADASFIVNSVTLRLINYKGEINIGFTGDVQINGQDVNFGVIAASIDQERTVTVTPALTVAKGNILALTFNRTVHPMPAFNSYQSRPAGPLGVPPPSEPLFDSEFFERDGVDFFKSELREGMAGFPASSGQSHSIVGTRCRQGFANLRF
jgi:hypothetical protein